MISIEKRMILTPLQKLPNNVGYLGKIIVATGFEWLPKVQKIAQSGHTDYYDDDVASAMGFVSHFFETVKKLFKNGGRKPWSSGEGRRLVIKILYF